MSEKRSVLGYAQKDHKSLLAGDVQEKLALLTGCCCLLLSPVATCIGAALFENNAFLYIGVSVQVISFAGTIWSLIIDRPFRSGMYVILIFGLAWMAVLAFAVSTL